jgi:hypothetical protein
MKKPKVNPNFPTTPILIFVICAGLYLLAVSLSNISNVHEGLETGRVYSVGIIFDAKRMIYRSNSPIEYWVTMGFYIFSLVASFGFGIVMPIGIIGAYTKKLARQKKERSEPHKPTKAR